MLLNFIRGGFGFLHRLIVRTVRKFRLSATRCWQLHSNDGDNLPVVFIKSILIASCVLEGIWRADDIKE
ncbi:hypothetical protein WM15_02320 [Burkholderia ubonensis]|nr:hypothetical protein WM15_02320 [Burkholderia ubonensis]